MKVRRYLHNAVKPAAKPAPRSNPLRIDPTRTAGLRRTMTAELRKRFRRLRFELIKLIRDEDALGLEDDGTIAWANNVWTANCGGPGSGVPGPCPGGKVAGAVGKAVAVAKAVGAKASHIEHVAMEFVSTKVQENLAKLPESLQGVVAGTYTVAKAGKEVAFAGWTASQAFAERLAIEKGATPEQAAALRSGLATVDILAFKPAAIALPAMGLGAASAAMWVVPPATAAYIVGAVATTHPATTLRAAGGLIRDTYKAFTDRYVTELSASIPKREPVPRAEPGEDMAKLVADAIEAHGYSDWFNALYAMAYNKTKDIPQALALADMAFQKIPEPVLVERPDDTQVVFGRKGSKPTTNTRWKFLSNPAKVEEFKKWIKTQRETWLKGTYGSAWQQFNNATDDELWRQYIEQGYNKGAGRAFDDVNKAKRALAGAEDKLPFYEGSREQFLQSSFGRPEALGKIKLLAARSYEDLENITTDMSTRMSRVLVDGLIQGRGPRELAKELANQVDLAEGRSLVIARTELIRAHAEGQLSAMEELGVEEVGVAVEWSTAGDERVCELCEPLEGVVMKLDEARGMIPRHPNCRCAWIPANVGETDEQKSSKSAIDAAIKASTGEDDEWGPGQDVARDRPQSIFNQALQEFDRWVKNCGGPGSGVPGPCPQGGGDNEGDDSVLQESHLNEINESHSSMEESSTELSEGIETRADDIDEALENGDDEEVARALRGIDAHIEQETYNLNYSTDRLIDNITDAMRDEFDGDEDEFDDAQSDFVSGIHEARDRYIVKLSALREVARSYADDNSSDAREAIDAAIHEVRTEVDKLRASASSSSKAFYDRLMNGA